MKQQKMTPLLKIHCNFSCSLLLIDLQLLCSFNLALKQTFLKGQKHAGTFSMGSAQAFVVCFTFQLQLNWVFLQYLTSLLLIASVKHENNV